MSRPSLFLSLAALVISASSLFGDSGERQVTRLADGVYAIEHQNLNDGNPSGNTTVIIGDREHDHHNGNKTYMDAFPALAIIAQEETKKDMDLIQPGNVERGPKELAATIAAFKQGKDRHGRALSEDDKKQVTRPDVGSSS